MFKKIYSFLTLLTAFLWLGTGTMWGAKTLPYSYGFEDNDLSVDGWTQYFGTSLSKNNAECRIIADAKKTGSYGFRFSSYQTSGANAQYLISPEFAASNGLELTFQYAASSTSTAGETFKVGYSTTDTDVAHFTWGEEVSTKSMSWKSYEGSFPAGTKYIAIYYYANYQYRLYIDDLAFSASPSCVKPTSLAVSEIGADTVKVTWESSATEFALEYKKTSDANWTAATGTITSPFILRNLTPNKTEYTVRVKAICGVGDESDWLVLGTPFETECGAKGLPFSETFDALGCWTLTDCVSGTGISSNTFMFKYGYANQYLISPELNTAGKQVTVEFDYHKATSGTETFMVGYSTTTNAVSAFTFGEEKTATNTSDLKYSEILPAGVKYIAIAYTSYDQYYFYVDNFTVTEYVAPACEAPTALAVSEIGTDSAKVTWVSEATEFALQYKKTSDANWTAATGTIASPFVLNDLVANETEYTVRVRAICGEDPSDWVELALPFKTDCENKTVTDLVAWEENFESQTSGKRPACWSEVSTYAASAYTQVNASAAKDGSLGVQVYVYSTHTEIALLPTFVTEIKNLKISFDYKNYGTATNYAALEVGYYSGTTFTNVTTLEKTTSFTASGEIEMPNDAPEGAHIAFRVVGKKSNYNGSAYIDNIVVTRKPSCAVPTITAANETSDGAVVTWTPGAEESAWNLRHSVKDADSWTVVENVTTGYAITGLTAGTTYEVQVQADCGGGAQSAWSASTEFAPVCNAPSALAVSARTQNSATFSWTSSESAWKLQYKAADAEWEAATEVNVATNPFTLEGLTAGSTYQAKIQSACGSDFSDEVEFTTWCDSKLSLPTNITSFSAVPACWEQSPAGAVSVANSKLCFIGEGEKFLFLPQTNINLNLLSATFTFSGTLEFGYIDAPNGDFHAFTTQPTSGVELNLENEAAAAKYIAIRYNGANSWAQSSISAISIRKTPTCFKPTNVAGDPGVGSASISWTAGGSEDAWNLQYKTGSAAWTTISAISENPYELSGLAQGTTYKVRVQAACVNDDPSDWSDEAQFTTDCETINVIPFEETFDAALSNCWKIYDYNTSYYAHSVYDGKLRLPGGKTGAGHVVVLPEITASLAKASLTITYSATIYKPEVGYVTNPNDTSTYVALEQLNLTNTATTAYVSLAAVPENANIALCYAGIGTTEGECIVEGLRVSRVEVFNDTEENEGRFATLNGETLDDLVLNRNILFNGDYNTLCLPFSLDAEQLAVSPLANFKIKAFDYATIQNEELLIGIAGASSIEAGVPCFVANQGNEENRAVHIFHNVTISASAPSSVDDSDIAFQGVFNPVDLTAQGETDDHNQLFLAAGNTIYWPAADKTVKGFRAYFNVQTSNPVIRRGMPARIVERTEVVTGIDNTNADAKAAKVLENNQVVIIRNGVKYNIQGQVISK